MNSNIYNPQEDLVLKDFVTQLKEKLGEHLKSIILFGSRARGDASINSDYDVFVIVDKPSKKLEQIVRDISYKMMEEHGELFFAMLESENNYKGDKWEPLFINIRNEGKTLYA